ncbi:hypothetical protein [Novosphingobium sp. 9]|uniref:hypothetical protein n=1 Tax=Novosphingobium sp. 9 TaxID=2025349 RepID=UPI0021B64A0C|nr:hypothetical protein [Novosphingobium sp. 9]
MRLYHPVSLLALLAASPVLAQDTRPSATTDSHQGPDIVVQGARPTAPLEGANGP